LDTGLTYTKNTVNCWQNFFGMYTRVEALCFVLPEGGKIRGAHVEGRDIRSSPCHIRMT